MAVSADIYRERSGNITKIATNVTPPFTDSDSQEGDKYYVVPTGQQPVVLEILPNISSFSVSNPSGQDVQITFDSDEQLGTSASDLSVEISGAESNVMARSDFTESGTGPYTYTGTYAGSSGGSYTATLQAAKDPRGNDGATGESDSVSVSPDSTAPTISNFSAANPSGQGVEVSFDSDEQLGSSSGDIDVGISGAESGYLSRGDFTESGTGPYTYTATYAGASDGDYTATLNAAKDSAGNDGASGQSSTVSVDTTAPSISNFSASNPSGQDVEVSFDSDEQLGGSAGDIDVGISGAETASLDRSSFTESGTGPYTYTAIYSGSTDGNYTATLNVARDTFGNDGASGESGTVTVDTTAPSWSTISTSGGYQYVELTGNYPDPSKNDLDVVRFYRGTSSGFTRDSNSLLTTINSPTEGGAFTITDEGSLQLAAPTNGQQYFYVAEADDTSGNTGVSGEVQATPFDTPASASFTKDVSGDPTVSVDASNSDGNAPLSYAWDFGDGFNDTGEVTTHTYATDGTYTVTLTVTDDDGDVDTATQNVTIIGADVAAPVLLAVRRDQNDTTAPTVTDVRVTNPQSQDVQVEVDTDEALGQDPGDLSVQIKLDGTDKDILARSDFTENESSGTYTYTAVYVGSADGTYEGIVQIAKDDVGNDGATGESDTVTVDTTAPSLPNLLAVRRNVDTTSLTITGFSASNPSSQDVQVSFDSSNSLTSIEVAISGAETATLTEADFTENSGTYTAIYPGSTDGDYTATLNQAVDGAGNDGATGQSATVTVTTGPTPTFNANASTTTPLSSVDLTIPHSELSTGKTVSLYAGGSDTGEDFTDGSTEYTLSYVPSAPIGTELDLQARVDNSTDASQFITIKIEEAPDPITDLSLTPGDTQFDASWTVPDTVEDDVQRMEIHVSTSSMADPQPGDSTSVKNVDSGFTEGSQITETVTGQTNGQQIYVQVLTIDEDGFFAASNEADVTPA